MTLLDRRELVHSGHDASAMAIADAALTDMLRFRGDPVGQAALALEQDPTLLPAILLQAHALAFSLHPRFLSKALALVDMARAQAHDEREGLHIAAIDAWLAAQFDIAAARLGDIVERWPQDLLALMFAHQADFFAGASDMLARRPQAVLAACARDMPGRGFVQGMAAFGAEEAGRYGEAAELAEAALASDSQDVWAIHAKGHVLEMQGLDEAGIAWYRRHEAVWSEDCVFACHNWWHLALYHLDRLDFAQALAVYDQGIAPDKRSITLNLCDATSLLWRLRLADHELGERFEQVADAFAAPSRQDSHPFNDIHAAIAFAATGRMDDLDALRSRLVSLSKGTTRYAEMTRRTVLPALLAWREFTAGHYADAADRLTALMPHEALMTGSHAQRDVLSLTLIEAELRAGRRLAAAAHIADRLAAKPDSAKWQGELRRAG